MAILLSMPDEILILICRNLNIPVALNLRLTHSRLASLIVEKSTSIAASIAFTTFPNAEILLRNPSGQRKDFEWLKSLVLKYNTAVLVDRFRLSSDRVFMEPAWIPAESEIGHELRARVENGWRVFHDLSKLLREVHSLSRTRPVRLSPTDRLRRLKIWREQNASPERYIKPDMLQGQLEKYLWSIPIRGLEDYQITCSMLISACVSIHNPHPVNMWNTHGRISDRPAEFDFNFEQGILPHRQTSWLNWALLYLGPYAFFQQWLLGNKKNDCHLVNQQIFQMWKDSGTEEIAAERNVVKVVRKTIEARGVREIAWMNTVMEECNKYTSWENGLERFHSGAPIPRAWMDEIHFLIDLREDGASV